MKAFAVSELRHAARPERHRHARAGPCRGRGARARARLSPSVNPGADAGIAGGMLKGMFEHEFPVVLGRDYAGTVEQVGVRRDPFRRGRRGLRVRPARRPGRPRTASGPS